VSKKRCSYGKDHASEDSGLDLDGVAGLEGNVGLLAIGDVIDAHHRRDPLGGADEARQENVVGIGQLGEPTRQRDGVDELHPLGPWQAPWLLDGADDADLLRVVLLDDQGHLRVSEDLLPDELLLDELLDLAGRSTKRSRAVKPSARSRTDVTYETIAGRVAVQAEGRSYVA